MKISFGIKEDGSVAIQFGSTPKASRPSKGHSLMIATNDFVAIDIETTGLSPTYDEIIELGAARYHNGELVDHFTSLVKPENPVNSFVTCMTGISNKMLEDAPSINQILPSFLTFVGNDILVGHNVNFDINFIYDACEEIGLPSFSNNFIDTMRIARRMYKELDHHTLDNLLELFNLEHRTLHRGLGDCEMTAACYLHMLADKERFDAAVVIAKKKHSSKQFSAKNVVAVEGMENIDSPLYGKVCVFTGALESFTRKEAAQIVVNIGGIVGDNVTKKTNFLILGNNDYCKSINDGKSGKQKKAEKYIEEGADLSIIPESVFLDILQMEYEDDTVSEELKEEAEVVKPDADKMEQEAFDLVAPVLKEMLVADNLSADYLFFKQSKTDNAQYSSAYLFNENSLFCRISFRGKQTYFSISSKYEELIPSDVEYKIQKSAPNYCRIPIASPDELANHLDLLKKILELQVDAYPSDFGCCSRYEACSDAMKCIHPNPDMALHCAYRKNMKKGRIFYGKNKSHNHR